MKRPVGLILAVMLLLLFQERLAQAQQKVSLQADVIFASHESVWIDPSIGPLAEELRKIFGYSNYQLLTRLTGNVVLQDSWRGELPGGFILMVIPREVRDSFISLDAWILQGRVLFLRTTIRLRNTGVILLGGPPYSTGVLIVALSAKTE